MDPDRCASRPDRPRPGRERYRHLVAIDARTRRRFFRRVAVGVIAVAVIVASSLVTVVWLLAERAGLDLGGSAPAVLGLLLMVAMFAGVAHAVRSGLGPLHGIMDAADRVAAGDYGVRVGERGAPPIRALARSFNAMTEQLQGADRLRRDLMADVAHELRTPLTVLQGRLEGLLDGVYPRDDAQLAALLEETQVLSRLIEDLRTLALADAGVLHLQREPADRVGLARDVVDGFQPEAARAGVSLAVTAAASSLEIEIDAVRIRQVIANLVANAIRHTPAGGAIAVRIEPRAGDVAVAVADAGEGIAPEDVGRIFERFYKGEASRGAGLGLTIAKRLVAAHGGEIGAVSTRGEGTTVTFVLPRTVAADASPE
jgi:signal transduction histidine kinase